MKPLPYPFLILFIFGTFLITSCKKESKPETTQDLGVFLRVNGGPWVKTQTPVATFYPDGSETYIRGTIWEDNKNIGSIALNWLGPVKEKRSYLWSNMGAVNFIYAIRATPLTVLYQEHYNNGTTWANSPGNLTITRYGNVGEMISGTFVIEKSGIYGDGKQTARIEGYFNAIRGENQ